MKRQLLVSRRCMVGWLLVGGGSMHRLPYQEFTDEVDELPTLASEQQQSSMSTQGYSRLNQRVHHLETEQANRIQTREVNIL
eukprot:1417257-Amphidinium_carterae.1